MGIDAKKIMSELLIRKKAKTINFDSIVLERLEDRAKTEGTTTSKLVNEIIRRTIMEDSEFYDQMARIHCAMMNHYQTLGGKK